MSIVYLLLYWMFLVASISEMLFSQHVLIRGVFSSKSGYPNLNYG